MSAYTDVVAAISFIRVAKRLTNLQGLDVKMDRFTSDLTLAV
jgi:hypothetical protein